MKKLLLVLIVQLSAFYAFCQTEEKPAPIHSTEPLITVLANAEFPIEPEADLFNTVGFGGSFKGMFPLSRIYPLVLSTNLGYTFLNLNADNSMSLVYLAFGGGIAVDFAKRFQLTAGAGIGPYMSFLHKMQEDPYTGYYYPTNSAAALYWQGGASLSFFITPALSIGVFGTFNQYAGLVESVRTGVVFSINIDGFSPNIEIEKPDLPTIYPAFSRTYEKEGLDRITLTNRERFSMKDVEINFQIHGLMAETSDCSSMTKIGPGETVQLDLVAPLGAAGLAHQSNETLPAVLTVNYALAGKKRSLQQQNNIEVLNRNALTWDDDRKVSAFISAKDEDVLAFSKVVMGIVQNDGMGSVHFNMRSAMAMYEALGVFRISYIRDPHSPAYIDAHKSVSIIDFIQYPNQTLKFKGGDCDDLTILYCSLLESIGIETAFITVPGHIYPAVNIEVPPSEVGKIFPEENAFIVYDYKTWLPLEITLLGKTFQEAWNIGMKEWLEADSSKSARLHPVHEAWKLWENAGSPADIGEIPSLDSELLNTRYREALDAYVDRQLVYQTEPLLEKLEQGDKNPRLMNRLAIVYANYGRLEQAAEILRAALEESSYVPAQINLGNIYLIQGKPIEAIKLFEEVRRKKPNNTYILAGLIKASSMTGEQLKVEAYLEKLRDLDPNMYRQLASLSRKSSEHRASELHSRSMLFWAADG
jgi:tetratricopeptide (TPR) repeat protein